MNYNEFYMLAQDYNLVPVYQKISADLLTPVAAFLKIRETSRNPFLLESVEGIGRLARYSFIGLNPTEVISNSGHELIITTDGSSKRLSADLFQHLQNRIKKYNHPVIDELPYFTGGVVGYIGFENISLIEDVITFNGKEEITIPDAILGVYNTIIVFDHFKHQIILITNADTSDKTNLMKKYESAVLELDRLKSLLTKTLDYNSDFHFTKQNLTEQEEIDFSSLVEECKKNIYAGDIFQIVLSKRFSADYSGDSFNVYRALRMINPSPYMYFMEFENDIKIIGTSPEDLLKVKNRKAEILPIAGTRRRGKNEEEDLFLENELMNDPKEIAEHTMLVDLARNDLGRVCEYNSIRLSENKRVNRFSHVMHIVSRVEGILQEDKDCIDALKASFPAGTVTGAPKIRAIQLINEYEKLRRGIYAGAVGYIDFSGNLDMCIAIRTLFSVGKKIFWQAGAGIVADSKPELELKEIKNKSAVLVKALQLAEVIDEDLSDR